MNGIDEIVKAIAELAEDMKNYNLNEKLIASEVIKNLMESLKLITEK